MDKRPDSQSTRRLVEDLVHQGSELIAVELALVRSELKTSSAVAAAGGLRLVVGATLLVGGLFGVLAALCALLVRCGLPVDAACFVVAVAALASGWALLRAGLTALSPGNLLPRRSFGRISSLFGTH